MRNLLLLLILSSSTLALSLPRYTCPDAFPAGTDLIKKFEGFSEHAYRDTDGTWAIGYGTRGPGITVTSVWPEWYASSWLEVETLILWADICEQITNPRVNGNHMAALVSFAYNVGFGKLKRSGILELVNAGKFKLAAGKLLLYNKSRGKYMKGLARRRLAEKALFLRPIKESYVEKIDEYNSDSI